MTTYVRHSDANHVVRPDRTIRTGVVPPLYGFSPTQDVMQNARAFTLGPYVYTQDSTDPASARGIAGLGGVPMLMGTPQLMDSMMATNVFQRMWLRFKANRIAKKLFNLQGLHGLGGPVPNGPASAMAPQVVPMMNGRVDLLAMMAEQHFPPAWGENAMAVVQNRWTGRNPWR